MNDNNEPESVLIAFAAVFVILGTAALIISLLFGD